MYELVLFKDYEIVYRELIKATEFNLNYIMIKCKEKIIMKDLEKFYWRILILNVTNDENMDDLPLFNIEKLASLEDVYHKAYITLFVCNRKIERLSFSYDATQEFINQFVELTEDGTKEIETDRDRFDLVLKDDQYHFSLNPIIDIRSRWISIKSFDGKIDNEFIDKGLDINRLKEIFDKYRYLANKYDADIDIYVMSWFKEEFKHIDLMSFYSYRDELTEKELEEENKINITVLNPILYEEVSNFKVLKINLTVEKLLKVVDRGEVYKRISFD